MPRLVAHGIQHAVEIVQLEINKYKNDGERVHDLDLLIHLKSPPGAGDDARRGIIMDEVVSWGRFVTLLQQSSNILQLSCLSFSDGCFLDRPEDNEPFIRLFRDVLPTLNSFAHLSFHRCKILPVYLDNIARLHNLVSLSLFACSLDSTNCELILKALDGNTHLENLNLSDNKISADAIARLLSSSAKKDGKAPPPPIKNLYLSGCSIDSPSCELILKGLDGNTYLESLNLSFNRISEISLEAATALGNCKNLRYLTLHPNPLSDQSLCHLAEGLRPTLSLRQLRVSGCNLKNALVLDAFSELLKTFTYTELYFGRPWTTQQHDALLHADPQIKPTRRNQLRELHCQNQLILALHEKLFQSESETAAAAATTTTTTTATTTTTTSSYYQLQQLYLWPLVLKCIGSKPSLIYRFVRHGNVESFMDQVLTRHNVQPKVVPSIICEP